MFRFLFKRSAKAVPPVSETQKKLPAERASDEASSIAADKAAAMAKARALSENESAAADFVLTCKFADARFQAASHIHSKALLESIAKAMRETDRRVAKLAQQRLDAIRQKETTEREALACVERVERLREELVVLPNQLSGIDRAWEALHEVSQELAQRFAQSRALVQQRLLDQAALQRAVIEVRNEVQQAVYMFDDTASLQLTTEEIGERLDSLSQRFAEYRAAPEAQALPKTLLSEVETSFARARHLQDQFAQRQAAIAAHESAYSAWEADSESVPDMDALRRQLRSLPALHAADAHSFAQRFESLQARVPKAVKTAAPEPLKVDMSAYRRKLEALEQALEEGALQAASEQDKELRAAEAHALNWKSDEASRLAKARAELSRLKGWAHWGGKVSREELIKAAEELPAAEVSTSELAKKIGSLRSQWKSMDATSGAADRDAWVRFDAACTAAYAPVAEHFNALSAERKANQEKALALLAQIREELSSEILAGEAGAMDVRKAAAFRSRMMQAWREIGPVDRKAKKELDKQFALELEALAGPLANAQQEEVKQREDLIAQAIHLDPADKKSMTALRQLQQQWQQHAKSFPLDRKHEQALWLRFRAACDEFFARRTTDLRQIEAQYMENFHLKNALCDRLESQAKEGGAKLESVLGDAAQQWNAIGPVPREHEQAVGERYRQAVAALRARLAEQGQAARRRDLAGLHKKLALCMAAEAATVARLQKELPALEEEWRLCGPVSAPFEPILQARFQAALEAIRSDDAGYKAKLNQNRAELERDLLRLEISAGIDSPPEWAAERLKLQVDALQASLKSGGQAIDQAAMLRKLCEMPAAADPASLSRIQRLFARFADSAGRDSRGMA